MSVLCNKEYDDDDELTPGSVNKKVKVSRSIPVLETNSPPIVRRRLKSHLFTVAFDTNLSANCNVAIVSVSVQTVWSLWRFKNLFLTLTFNFKVSQISIMD